MRDTTAARRFRILVSLGLAVALTSALGLHANQVIIKIPRTSTAVNPIAATRQPAGNTSAPNTAWASAGVTGGITHRTTRCGSVINAYGTSGSPASPDMINNAIGSCGANQYVELGAGTFYLNAGVELDVDNVTLRGQGADSTILNISGNTNVGCHIGAGRVFNICANGGNIGVDSADNTATWSAGYAQGTTTITLSTVTNLSVGSTIWLDQEDDPSDGYPATGDLYMCNHGATNCANNGDGETFARTGRGVLEGHLVTNISGSDVTISPGVVMPHIRSAQNPGAWWGFSSTILEGAGLEDLTIDATPALSDGIYVINATNSWIKGVRVLRTDTTGSAANLVSLINAEHVSVVDSYFYGPVATGTVAIYGVTVGPASSSLIQNDIFHKTSSPVVMNAPFYGNVVAYNYVDASTQASVFLHAIGAMNLYEGNNGSNWCGDTIHASHAFETTFRNHWDGTAHNAADQEAQAAHVLYSNNRFFNLVGNIQNTQHSSAYKATSSHNQDAIYEFGWQGTGSGDTVPNDSNVNRTVLVWGNWDNVTNAVRWCGNSSNTGWSTTCSSTTEVPSGITNYPNPIPTGEALPVSLYLSAKPSWFGSVTWPPIGPDVSSGNISGYGGHANKIPARVCFEAATNDSAYPSSSPRIKAFNANTCYP